MSSKKTGVSFANLIWFLFRNANKKILYTSAHPTVWFAPAAETLGWGMFWELVMQMPDQVSHFISELPSRVLPQQIAFSN